MSKLSNRFTNLETKKIIKNWWTDSISDKIFATLLFIWIIPIFLTLIIITLNFSNLPNEIPLFYSKVWGQHQLAKNIYILLPLFGNLCLGLFNFSLAISFHSRDKIFSYLFAGAISLVSLLCTITTIKIVLLIT